MDWTMHVRQFNSGFGARLMPILRRHWRLAGGALLLVAAAFGAGLLTASHASRPAAVVVPYPHELAQVSFAVAGDVIPHEPVRAAAAAAPPAIGPNAGWGALFSDVCDVFQRADFGFVNMETPVAPATPAGRSRSCSTPPCLARSPQGQRHQDRLVRQQPRHGPGLAGFAETREHLRERACSLPAPATRRQHAWQPVITEANGIKVGWLGMTRWLNGNRNPDKDDQPHVNFFPYPGESGGATGQRTKPPFLPPSNGAREVRFSGGLHSLGHRVRARAAP